MEENRAKTIVCDIADGCNYWTHQLFVHAVNDTFKGKGAAA